MEKIEVRGLVPIRPLTTQEQAELPTPESFEQIKIEAENLWRGLRVKRSSRVGPPGAGLDIICR